MIAHLENIPQDHAQNFLSNLLVNIEVTFFWMVFNIYCITPTRFKITMSCHELPNYSRTIHTKTFELIQFVLIFGMCIEYYNIFHTLKVDLFVFMSLFFQQASTFYSWKMKVIHLSVGLVSWKSFWLLIKRTEVLLDPIRPILLVRKNRRRF